MALQYVVVRYFRVDMEQFQVLTGVSKAARSLSLETQEAVRFQVVSNETASGEAAKSRCQCISYFVLLW